MKGAPLFRPELLRHGAPSGPEQLSLHLWPGQTRASTAAKSGGVGPACPGLMSVILSAACRVRRTRGSHFFYLYFFFIFLFHAATPLARYNTANNSPLFSPDCRRQI